VWRAGRGAFKDVYTTYIDYGQSFAHHPPKEQTKTHQKKKKIKNTGRSVEDEG
jgi:hypothetical protein